MNLSHVNKHIDIDVYWEHTKRFYDRDKTFVTKQYIKNKIKEHQEMLDGISEQDKMAVIDFFEMYVHENFWNYYTKSLTLIKKNPIRYYKTKNNIEFVRDDECRSMNIVKKGYLLLFSHDPRTNDIFYLLAQDAAVQGKNHKHRILKELGLGYNEIRMNSVNEDYDDFQKWGLIGGSKKNYSESILETTSREFIEETMGLVLGGNHIIIKRMLANKEYFKRITLSQGKVQYVIFIKSIKYNWSLDSIEKESSKLYQLLLDLRGASLILKDIEDNNKLNAKIKKLWNKIASQPIAKYVGSPRDMKEDYIEKQKLKWWNINDIVGNGDEMKRESSIILFADYIIRGILC